MQNGIFISFEGPDGSGKSSLIKKLKKDLQSYFKREIIYSREPGGSPLAESIRHLMLDPSHSSMDSRTEALLFAASRRQHLVEVVKPALNQGKVVISDRYVDSSIAYQGYGRHLGAADICQLNQFAIEDLWPDLTLYIDVPAEVGLDRIKTHRQQDDINRLDQETLDFHRRVCYGYQQLLEADSKRIQQVDGQQELDQVAKDCLNLIKNHFS